MVNLIGVDLILWPNHYNEVIAINDDYYDDGQRENRLFFSAPHVVDM